MKTIKSVRKDVYTHSLVASIQLLLRSFRLTMRISTYYTFFIKNRINKFSQRRSIEEEDQKVPLPLLITHAIFAPTVAKVLPLKKGYDTI